VRELLAYAGPSNPIAASYAAGEPELLQGPQGVELRTTAGTRIHLVEQQPAHGVLSQCRLALTTVGANTAELGALGVPMIVLRPDQTAALDQLRACLARGSRRVVMQCSTGWGKTVLAAEIAKRAVDRGNRVMFVVPALSLIDQTVARFRAHGIEAIGVIQADHELTNYAHKVQVCSVQTLERRRFPMAQVVIVDEVHRWFGFYAKWFADPEWLSVPVIGLSATPIRQLRFY
jgi:superfamily II DNA or RNA helicase